MFSEIKGPAFYDYCRHGKDTYVASFTCNKNKYDIYLYNNNEVCIRYGSFGSAYLSPGKISNLTKLSGIDPIYDAVFNILTKRELIK